MEALHHDDDCAVNLVVKTRQQCVFIPLDGLLPDGFGLRVLRLDRIVDNDDVAATAGERAADRSGQAITAFRGAHLGFRVLGFVDPGSRKGLLVPIGPHDGAAIIGELRSQIVAVADTDELLGRVVPEQECGQRHGRADGFEVPRRDVDDQARGGAAGYLLKDMGDGLGGPVLRERDPRIDGGEDLLDEGIEIVSQESAQQFLLGVTG